MAKALARLELQSDILHRLALRLIDSDGKGWADWQLPADEWARYSRMVVITLEWYPADQRLLSRIATTHDLAYKRFLTNVGEASASANTNAWCVKITKHHYWHTDLEL